MNKNNTLENSQKIDQNIMPIFSPINSSKNKVVINFNTNMRNKPKNISTIDNEENKNFKWDDKIPIK